MAHDEKGQSTSYRPMDSYKKPNISKPNVSGPSKKKPIGSPGKSAGKGGERGRSGGKSQSGY